MRQPGRALPPFWEGRRKKAAGAVRLGFSVLVEQAAGHATIGVSQRFQRDVKCVEKNSGGIYFSKTISAGIVLGLFGALANALELSAAPKEDEENEEDEDDENGD